MRYLLLSLILANLPTTVTLAQETPYTPSNFNENYIADHSDDLVLRVYGSNKFTKLNYGEYGDKDHVQYKSNSNYNVGVGFNYKWLGINLGFKTPFINEDNDVRGRTKYLDLQAYAYLRKLVIDFYGQSYEGYYLTDEDILKTPVKGNIIRDDIQTRNIGFNVEYIFNHDRFSYRAAYLQNETQRKSAGTFLAGGGFHYLNVRADKSILPGDVKYPDYFNNQSFNHSSVGALTLNVGYAYNLVLNEHFFLIGSLSLGAGLNSMTLKDDFAQTNETQFSATYNGILRAGLGYSSDQYFVGLYFVTNLRQDEMPINDTWQRYETGVIRLALAKRFTLKQSVVDRLHRTGLFDFPRRPGFADIEKRPQFVVTILPPGIYADINSSFLALITRGLLSFLGMLEEKALLITFSWEARTRWFCFVFLNADNTIAQQ